MIESDNDIHESDAIIVFDLEWIGNSFKPHKTHVSQLACKNVRTGSTFFRSLRTLSSNNYNESAASPRQVYHEWLQWLHCQSNATIYLVAHNGIRYDAPVLRHSMIMHGVAIPDSLKMLDSLYHVRHHSRYWNLKPARFDIDSLCSYFNIFVNVSARHTALYDVKLLCSVLNEVCSKYRTPFISGAAHSIATLSTMLANGIGPVVYEALPFTDLTMLCTDIVRYSGSLSLESNLSYLKGVDLKERVPLCNLNVISNGILCAAKQYLQYLE